MFDEEPTEEMMERLKEQVTNCLRMTGLKIGPHGEDGMKGDVTMNEVVWSLQVLSNATRMALDIVTTIDNAQGKRNAPMLRSLTATTILEPSAGEGQCYQSGERRSMWECEDDE